MMKGKAFQWSAAEAAASDAVAQWAADGPGGAIVGFDRDGLRFAVSGGLADLNHGLPFTPDTVSRCASVTKHLLCAMVLSHPEAIALDDPLGAHLPELAPALAEVTVARALSMTGGLADTRESLSLLGLSSAAPSEAGTLMAYHARMTGLNFAAGSEVSYSNAGYRLVEEALKRRGLTLVGFVAEAINGPLGTRFAVPEHWGDPVLGLAPGYWHDGAQWQPGGQGMHLSAAGSLAASATDMARWVAALLAGQGVLSGLWDGMSAQRSLSDGTETPYGLGLYRVPLGDHVLIGHSGAQAGYRAQFLTLPEAGVGVVVLSNRDDVKALSLVLATFAALLEAPMPVPVAPGTLPTGLYVEADGPRWVEVKATSLVHMGTEEALYDGGEGWAESCSGTAPMRLRWTGAALEGSIGHAPCRLLPVGEAPLPEGLEGHWHMPEEGAVFEIRDGMVHWGIGPSRRAAPLTPLGTGRALFLMADGPARRPVCLVKTGADSLTLGLNRARAVPYVRLR
ncbi:serine hydrolase domain-containing protein [Pseudooceanicola nanhaiensis]|uniref:serine hydrolase domain-containing protein n=1 Tax=Pseudooceanicola nanhaiensis TaxID=375761 RepID=UPI001CD729BA|nr:serine hydrolase domain-containing protein [Pseudooceanicola nanhaiensis]MCA0921894.1 beta-lactamase family protein [Pseudooceanicola nanhaiensis]